MVEGSNKNEEAQPKRETRVQRRFTPDQSLKPKLLDESANLLEVKDILRMSAGEPVNGVRN